MIELVFDQSVREIRSIDECPVWSQGHPDAHFLLQASLGSSSDRFAGTWVPATTVRPQTSRVVLPRGATLHEHAPVVIGDEDGKGSMQCAGLVCPKLFLGSDIPIVAVDEYDAFFDAQVIDFPPGWTKRQPKRPLMQRLPSVMELSSGDVDFTISPSCSCRVRVHPTPQYGQIVSVAV